MSTTTPPRPVTVYGGDALDWYQAYMQVRHWGAVHAGKLHCIEPYWPARRLPIVRPIEEPA